MNAVLFNHQIMSDWQFLLTWLPELFPWEPEWHEPTPAANVTDRAQLAGREAEHTTQWFDMAAEDDESGTLRSFSSKFVQANSFVDDFASIDSGPPKPLTAITTTNLQQQLAQPQQPQGLLAKKPRLPKTRKEPPSLALHKRALLLKISPDNTQSYEMTTTVPGRHLIQSAGKLAVAQHGGRQIGTFPV